MKNFLKIILFSGLLFLTASLGATPKTDMETFAPFLNSIEQLEFPSSDYFRTNTVKKQVTLHHTASGKGVSGDYATFLKPGHIATPIIVGHEKVYQLFSSRYWGYHLGVKSSVFKERGIPYQRLDEIAIGLEIDSWGPLKLIDGEYRTYINRFGEGNILDRKGNKLIVTVPHDEVVHYATAFRGYNYYQKYNQFQIDSVATLLRYWNKTYQIPLTYNEDMWNVSNRALKGEPGVFTHVSYRVDKSDCHPQPELIEMLQNLV